MQLTHTTHGVERPRWLSDLITLLPLWLIAAGVSVEGFPQTVVPGWVFLGEFILGIILCIVFIASGWMRLEIGLYSLTPLLLFFLLDEIVRGYKTPFILMAVLLLSAGLLLYNRRRHPIILIAAIWLLLLIVSNASRNYWDFVTLTGRERCFMDCVPPPETWLAPVRMMFLP